MFSSLARFAARFKYAILLVWLTAAAYLFIYAPALAEVGVTDDSQFLPRDTESTVAQKLLDEKFAPSFQQSPGSATLVIFNPAGLGTDENQEAHSLQGWLVSKNAPAVISGVASPFDNAALQLSLISKDQTTLLINLDLSLASSSAPAKQAVKDIRTYIQSQNYTSQVYLTGSAGISSDLLNSVQQTIDKATLVTVILVFVLLLIIYRSPIAILVPLLTIGISYLISRGLAGYIAASGVNVSSLADAYLVVTLFGIGTDYCLFMVSRFKEEVYRHDHRSAGEHTLKRIGPVILASATTVIVALLCLGISQFGMNRTSGFILALGVAVTLLAGLTLAPALIYLFGEKLLWPGRLAITRKRATGTWEKIGTWITRRPAAFAIPLIIILALPYLALPGMKTSADILTQMPTSVESVKGFNILSTHFPAGQLGPVAVIVQASSGPLSDPTSLKQVAAISGRLGQISGVASVDYPSSAADQISSLSTQARAALDALAAGDATQLNFFPTMAPVLQKLVLGYPGIIQSNHFQSINVGLSQIQMLTGQLQSGQTAIIPQILIIGNNVADSLSALSREFNLEVDSPFANWLRSSYLSMDGSAAKIGLILTENPYSSQAMATLDQIRQSLDSPLSNGYKYFIGGVTAVQSDIIAVNDSDFIHVLLLAVLGIFVVTALLIRSLIAPLYMILTVLFNFGATLGIATWLFLDVLKQNSIIYMLPIFVFVMLVAVGSDYNIFLVSRIREENRSKPLQDAICSAISNTGSVITSCGIILAGTFATLTTASLQLVFQVGAAIGLGVLIDTFLVRAILIPSLASLVGKWNWWPSRTSHKPEKMLS